MGETVVPGPISGRNYGFRIAGDAPTVDEQRRIDDIIRQREAQFTQEYEARFGAPVAAAEGSGLLDYLGEIPKGVLRGGIEALTGAVPGLVEAAPESWLSPESRDWVRNNVARGSDWLTSGLQPDIGFEGNRAAEVVGGLSSGLGSFGALLGVTWANPMAGVATAVGMGANEAAERAREEGATPDERRVAAQFGIIPGVLELMPVGALLKSRVGQDVALTIIDRIRRVGMEAGIEAAQETASQYAQNLIEQGVYNPGQALDEGLIGSAGYGAGVGGIAQALMDLAIPGRRGTAAPPAPPAPAAARPLALPPPSAFPPPDVIAVPPTGPQQVSGQPGGNIPAYPRAATPSAAVAPPLALPSPSAFPPPPVVTVPPMGPQQVSGQPGGNIPAYPRTPQTGGIGAFAAPAAPATPPAAAPVAATAPTPTAPIPTPPVTPSVSPAVAPAAPKARKVRSPLAQPTVAAPAPVVGTTPTAPTETVMPTLPVQEGQQPLTKDTMREVLRSVGVPPTAAVANAVESGEVRDAPTFETRLQRFAANTKNPDAKKRALEYLRVQEAERNTAPPAVEEPNAEATATEDRGLDAPDVAPAGVGVEGGRGDEPVDTGDSGTPAPAAGIMGLDPGRLEQSDSGAVRPADAADAQYAPLTPSPAAPPAPTAPVVAAPVAPVPAPEYAPMSGAIPGTPTGTAGQVIPRGVPGAPVLDRANPAKPNIVSDAPRLVAEELAAEADIVRANAAQAVDSWFRSNAPVRVQEAFDRIAPADRETSDLRADDMAQVMQLLLNGPRREQNKNLSPEGAARRYFSRSPDPGYALHMMAYDAALARLEDQPGFYTARTIRGDAVRAKDDVAQLNDMQAAEPLTEALDAEIAMLEGLGPKAAQLAERWVEATLSPEAVAEFRAMRDGRATVDRAAYAARDYETQSTLRDRSMVQKRAAAVEDAALPDAGVSGTRRGERITPEREQALRQKQETERAARSARIAAIQEAESKVVERQAAPSTRKQPSMPKAPWSASFSLWEADAHPRVGALLRNGDLTGALNVLAMTAPNRNMRLLAEKLVDRVSGTQVEFVSPDEMARIRSVLSPETPTLGVEAPSGVYIQPRSPAQIDAMRRENHNEAADLIERYAGRIIFNGSVPLAPELVLHEAVHAVADATLTKPSHVLTRQLETLRVTLLKTLPPESYGLTNVREMLAEAMTNPVFRTDLAFINVDGKPYSAWAQIKHTLRNFLRSLMGRPTVKMDSAQDTLDRALDRVLADGPGGVGAGEFVGASFAPNPMARVRELVGQNMRMPTKEDAAELGRVMRSLQVPPAWKDVLVRAAMPLEYVGEAAQKYLPSATQVHALVRQHKAEQERISNMAGATVNRVRTVLDKYADQQDKIDAINKIRLVGSMSEVDARKPRSAYMGYDFSWYDVRPDGSRGKLNVSKRYATEAERDAALNAKRASLPAEQRRTAKVRRRFDEDAEQLAVYAQLKALYDPLPADLKQELDRIYALPIALSKELTAAVKARLEALLPQNRKLQDKIFGEIYDKILAGQLIDPYQALRREGNYWVTYSDFDPETGRVELFKHAFTSLGQQQAALRVLAKKNEPYYAEVQRLMGDPRPLADFIAAVESGDPATKVTIPLPIQQAAEARHFPARSITPYQNVGEARRRPQVPMEFVAKVLDQIDGTDGLEGDVKGRIVELMFDTMPETSFMNSFRKRGNIRGFEGDFTTLTQGLTAGDTIANINRSNAQLARQVADLKYGAKFAALRAQLDEEYAIRQNKTPVGVTAEEWARQNDEMRHYRDLLTEYTSVPFQHRSKAVGTAVSATYMATLGFNVSSAVLSTMSLPVFYAPVAGGRYGYRNTMSAIGHATRSLGGTGKTRSVELVGSDGKVTEERSPVSMFDFSLDNKDFTDPKNAYLKPLHDMAKTNGVFYRSLVRDELMGEDPTFVQRVAGVASILQHHAERYVRETSLLATYNMDLQQQMKDTRSFASFVADLESGKLTPTPEQATRAAERAIEMSDKTSGPMFAAAGPKWSTSNFGSLVYLFKRHPLAMMNLLAQTAQKSFGENTPERAIARKQIAGMMGMLALTSGALGLPMMQQVAWLYNLLLADDDEPDFDSMIQMQFGALGSYGAIDYLTGLRVSERIGLGGAFYRTGFASDQMPPLFQFAEGIGGPVLGMALKYTGERPWALLAEGQYGRFGEAVLPSAMANLVRAARYAEEGIRTGRFDPMVDDIGPFGIAAQVVGFMPAEYAQQLSKNAMGSRINNAINTQRSRLLQQRYVATRQGDMEAVREIDAEIREFNQRHPYFPITREVLERSMRSHEETTSRMHHGVAYTPALDPMIRQMMEDWGPASVAG